MIIWNLLPLGHELVKYLEFGGGVFVPVSCSLSKCLPFCNSEETGFVSLNWEGDTL